MDWLSRMNSAIRLIEDNLTEEIDYDKIAEIACCSVYHFQRMFSFITDIPLSQYIRRRRFTIAAFEIQNSDIRIIDLAVKYGYDSADSFSRAFQKVHGVTPSLARDRGVQLKAYPRISFQISIKGDVEMNYRIEEKEAFKVFGISTELKFDESDIYEDAKTFLNKSIGDGTSQMILDAVGKGDIDDMLYGEVEDNTIKQFGMFLHYGWNKTCLRFMIAMDYPDYDIPEHFEVLEVPKSTWAVFKASAPVGDSDWNANVSIEHIWKRLYEWFQVSDYEQRANVPELEKEFRTKTEYIDEVWIPIIKK